MRQLQSSQLGRDQDDSVCSAHIGFDSDPKGVRVHGCKFSAGNLGPGQGTGYGIPYVLRVKDVAWRKD